ncbi:hypothetical protein J4E91_001515 [Alternaria rosae]|nr:hypothetical protein J4E91_001515 [Alternaria rosae]
MDIFIPKVPKDANHVLLHFTLQEALHSVDVFAFDVRKFSGQYNDFAILTIPSVSSGNRFLEIRGSQGRRQALQPLYFGNQPLDFRQSNKRREDPLQLKSLKEKQETEEAKRFKGPAPIAKLQRPGGSTLSFRTLMTGVWDYDHLGKLVFDQKLNDRRQGYITFGKNALVIYLRAETAEAFNWHCRIDIDYATIEHIIPSRGNGQHGTITFTLKSPPKFYDIQSTNDLHLYAGEQAPNDISVALSRLGIKPPKSMLRLQRLCKLSKSHDMNSALCMVYKIAFSDTRSVDLAWTFVKPFFAEPNTKWWKTMEPAILTGSIEHEYAVVNKMLSDYGPSFPQGFTFNIRYQLTALMLEGTIAPWKMKDLIPVVQKAAEKHGAELTANAVRLLGKRIPTPTPGVKATDPTANAISRRGKRLPTPAPAVEAKSFMIQTIKRILDESIECCQRLEELSRTWDAKQKKQNHLALTYKATVTPTGILLRGPDWVVSNRILRKYNTHTEFFMRVFFADEDELPVFHDPRASQERVYERFRGVLRTDTTFSVPISKTAYVNEMKDDVTRNNRTFSDGCGTLSLKLFQDVWNAFQPDRRALRPTVLQVRFRGAKGVLSLDTTLQGEQLHARKSMTKYVAKEEWRDLEICGAAYKPLRVYLNHQFIKILEDLRIPAENFKAVQDEAVAELKLMTEHPLNAASLLEYSHSGDLARVPSLFRRMNEMGLSFHADNFLTDIVEVAAMSSLRDIKYRARIPIEKGCLLYGIMDEWNVLKEGEVYIPLQDYDTNDKLKRTILVGERIVITRAPALHPGDIQVVKAVDVPEGSALRALHNCVVFSQQGPRDLPSKLSGGDLDGDLFHIIHDTRLIPSIVYPPADYPTTPAKDLGRPVTADDIVDFFIEYMNMDRLGQISNKHKIRADKAPAGTVDRECLLLAKLASDAVDFGKSGIPANMAEIPRGSDHIRPDFMAPGSNLFVNELGAAELEELEGDELDEVSVLNAEKPRSSYYTSTKILGVLYRRIDEKTFFDKMKNAYRTSHHRRGDETLVQKLKRYVIRETRGVQWEHHWDFAEQLREAYEENMFEIMDTHRPSRGQRLTELEVFSGNILGKKDRAPSRYVREANLEVQERFNRDVSDMIKNIVMGNGDWDGDADSEALPRSIACFMVALETDGWENYRTLRSWKYVAAAVCLEQLWKYNNGYLRRL